MNAKTAHQGQECTAFDRRQNRRLTARISRHRHTIYRANGELALRIFNHKRISSDVKAELITLSVRRRISTKPAN